jgi:uncharacterized protein involved in exopolysaccharide biosynthesis
MYKPIIKNDEVSFNNLWIFAMINFKRLLSISLIGVFLFCFYFLIKTPSYSSKISFYTNYTESATPSFLTSVLGAAAGGSSKGLKFSIKHYTDSDRFLNEIVEQKYIIEGKTTTLVDYWGKDFNNFITLNPISFLSKVNKNLMLNKKISDLDQKRHFAKEKLSKSIKYSEDRLQSHHEVVVTLNHQELSKDIVTNIHKSLLKYSNEVTNIKASEKRIFIDGRIQQVKNDLENSENKMIDLLQNNRDLSSPILLVKKERIQREIALFSQLYLSLSDKLESAKIDEKDTTSPIFLLDSPSISSYKAGVEFYKSVIFVLFFVFMLALSFELYNHRQQLFK